MGERPLVSHSSPGLPRQTNQGPFAEYPAAVHRSTVPCRYGSLFSRTSFNPSGIEPKRRSFDIYEIFAACLLVDHISATPSCACQWQTSALCERLPLYCFGASIVQNTSLYTKRVCRIPAVCTSRGHPCCLLPVRAWLILVSSDDLLVFLSRLRYLRTPKRTLRYLPALSSGAAAGVRQGKTTAACPSPCHHGWTLLAYALRPTGTPYDT